MHHYRRKSGHGVGNTSTTDVRRAVTASDLSYNKKGRPATMTRKITPQNAPKLGKSPRDRERELDDDRWWDEERESFPQHWYVFLLISQVFTFHHLFSPLEGRPFPFHLLA